MQSTRIEINEGVNDTIIFPSWIKSVYNDESRKLAQKFYTTGRNNTNELMQDFWTMNKDDKVFEEVKTFIINEGEKVVEQYYDTIDERYKRPNVYKIKMGRTWINLNVPGEGETPHHHRGAAFSAVFYIKTHPKAGDLILIDPRTTSAMSTFVVEEKNGDIQTDRAFKRITPQTGSLIFFPGHLLHYVETNLSPYDRICLASNFG